jgi:hypothetical protein
MTISERAETFFGKAIEDFEPGTTPSTASDTVYRLSLDYDAEISMEALLSDFLETCDKSSLEALVIGSWGEAASDGPGEFLALLAAQASELPNFKALFVGDITYEECEISWIVQGDYAPLLDAYPGLQALRLRGSTQLDFPAVTHAGLRELTIECGGLPSDVCNALAQSSFPALTTLELWIGTDDYGFDGDVALVKKVVDKLRTPGLRHLGLRDAQIADGLAQYLAGEAWIGQLATLDLSLGTLGDLGAQALLASPHARGLARLDLSHHYISQPVQAQLRAAIPGVVLDDEQNEDDDEDRYVAVGE